MRHHDRNRKFGRTANARVGLMRSLAVALIDQEKITTTEARAKELRPYIERLVTKGRGGDLAGRRLLQTRLGGNDAAAKKLTEIAARYADRPGGYTRITKLPNRDGDAARMAVIEFV